MIAKFKRQWPLVGLLLALLASSGCRSEGPARSEPRLPNRPSTPAPEAASAAKDSPLIIAFGDSLTAGYGLPDPGSQSYPALLQKRLDEGGYSYRVVNAGVSGDTSAGGVRRIDWALKGDAHFLILELGANDALRGQPTVGIRNNLSQIIEAAQKRNVRIVLAGMEALPNLGPEYTREFRQVFRDLAKEYQVKLVPFFLEGVGGIADLNQADGIHPNVRGTEVVADNIWRALEPMLAGK